MFKFITLTKVPHFANGEPMAHHSKFAAKGTARSTFANYGKQINKRKMASLPLFAKNSCFLDIGKTAAVNCGLTVFYLFGRKR